MPKLWIHATVVASAVGLIWLLTGGGDSAARAAPPALVPASAFKITFGLRNRFPNVSWAGGIRDPARVRTIEGWHLDTIDLIHPPNRWDITLRPSGRDVTPKGVVLDLTGPEEVPLAFFSRVGDFAFVPASIPFGKPYIVPGLNGDVTVERVPRARKVTAPSTEDDDPSLIRRRDGSLWLAWVAYRTVEQNGFYVKGTDQVMMSHSVDGESWSTPAAVTPPGDHFRVALGEDAAGALWCVYGLQEQLESGNFDLFARSYDGRQWSSPQRLTSNPLPDTFHRMASDSTGNLYLVWMSYRALGSGAAPQSDIFMRVHNAAGWSPELRVTESAENDWEPSVATGPGGRAWIVWDSYRSTGGQPASYDLLLRSYAAGQFSPVQTVSATPFAEMRGDVAVDRDGRAWVAWEEGGANWGKDTGYENPKHAIYLRKGGSLLYGPPNSPKALYRRPRVAVLENDQWRQTSTGIEQAFPEHLQSNLFQNPRLGVDGHGRVWVFLRHQLIARGRNAGHLFDYYATTPTDEGAAGSWLPPVLIPGSTGRQDTVLSSAPVADGLAVAVVGDGRRLPVGLPENHDILCAVIDSSRAPAAKITLTGFQPGTAAAPAAPHPNEASEVERIRSYRMNTGSQRYKIVRGDLHRHTEISMDGAIDGTIWDLYRYSLDSAAFDFIAVTEHNNGAWLDTDEPESRNTDDVYQWWRIQKSADLFHVPGRFVPLYGYERSINFPLGHRNIFHVRRGVFTLRVPKLHIAERPDLIESDAQNLWSYLRSTGGVGLPHTSGTSMGTDWRLRDDPLEPVAEIYQGDRNSYEEQGAPRAAIPEAIGDGQGGRQPFQKGLIWNALGAGYKMGFIASSDHFSTHISYANLLVPDRVTTREDIQNALRSRRSYASTDNIVIDFSAGPALQGDAITASETPAFQIKVAGTAPILRLDVIKNNRVIFTRRGSAPNPSEIAFVFRDNAESGGRFDDTSMSHTSQIKDWQRPETGIRPRPNNSESYYYVRVVQSFSVAQPDREGEVAWSSPIFVAVKPR